MGFRPLQDWALIRREEPAERTAGGIIIPDSAKDKPAEGVVLAIGPGKLVKEKGKKEKKFVATVLKPGERVMFIEYMAKDVEVGGETITLIREEDILGTVEGEREVMVKPSYQIEAKQERPPMVQPSPAVQAPARTAVTAKAGAKKKPSAKKPAAAAASRSGGKKAPVKAAGAAKAAKKSVKKTAKPAPAKATKKTVARKPTAAKQKVKAKPAKAAAKKAVSKKPSAKTAGRKTASGRPAPKKTAGKPAARKSVRTKGRKK